MLHFILNPENASFCDNAYLVTLGVHYSFNGVIIADCEQEALDVLIDHFEDNEEKNPAFFLSDDDINALTSDELDEVITGGNHGRMLSFTNDELRVEEVSRGISKETLYLDCDK